MEAWLAFMGVGMQHEALCAVVVLVLNSQIFFDIPFFKRWSPIPLFLSLA
jgi:hypothetical protein